MCAKRAFLVSRRAWRWVCAAALFYTAPAFGETGDIAQPPQPQASFHFQRGYELSQSGAFERASRHFEAAYALEPSPAVLYNLGQAYAASGQPVEALRAFRKCLGSDESELPSALRERVVGALDVVRSRIGRLEISVSPPSADILLDGRRLDVGARSEPIELKAGPHVVTSELDGFASRVQVIDVLPERDNELQLVLQRRELPGHIMIACPLPSVAVNIDERMISHRSSLAAPIAVPPGRHTVILSRTGYRTEEFHVDVPSEGMVRLSCRGEIDASAHSSAIGTVILQGIRENRSSTTVYVNGRIAAPVLVAGPEPEVALRLPIGPQSIEVRRRNYESWSRELDVSADVPSVLRPRWVPTPAYRDELSSAARRRATWSRIAWGAGASAGVSAAVLGFAASQRHDDWARERSALSQRPIDDPSLPIRLRDHQRRALGIQKLNDAAVGLGILATAILGTAAWLEWSGESGLETSRTTVPAGPSTFGLTLHREGAQLHYAADL